MSTSIVALDGVYAADDDDHPQFQPSLAPEDKEIAQLTALLAERIPALLRRRGLGPETDPEESDSLRRDEPCLAGLYAASVTGRVAFGPNAGQRVIRYPRRSRHQTGTRPPSVTFSAHQNCSRNRILCRATAYFAYPHHATLHRGQVVGMIRQLGIVPPTTDLLSYLMLKPQ